MPLNQLDGNLKVPISERDHAIGPAAAPLTLLEYGDYQCPHCGRAHGEVDEIRRQFGDRLRFVFRHFPLPKVHPLARLAAEAAEAAGAQGKFWQMHHLLYTHQDQLEPVHLLEYARQAGLDIERFRREVEAHAYEPRVREDMGGGIKSGVNGTPRFFINGRRHEGGYDMQGIIQQLNEAEGRIAGSLSV